MRKGPRAFLLGFGLGATLLLGPFVGLMGRLVALGEIDVGIGADRTASLRGTLFADTPVQKLRDVDARRPEVIVLGSSRVGSFRADMFAGCSSRPACFYNATGAMPSTRTGLDFVNAMPSDDMPRLLILGVDVWDVDPGHTAVVRDEDRLRRGLREQLDHAVAVTRSAAQVVASDPDVRNVVLGLRTVAANASGLAAIVHRTGYRQDGSIEYPVESWKSALEKSDDARSADYLRLVRIGGFEFEPFEHVDGRALSELAELVDAARREGVAVVAFTPPFSDALAAAMRSQPHYAGGLAEAYAALRELFRKRSVPFVDGMTLADYGCGSDEHIDGLHVGDVCAARILLALSERGPDPFLRYVDTRSLAARIAARSSSFVLPPQ